MSPVLFCLYATSLKSPYEVGISTSINLSINDSCFILYFIRSAIEINLSLNFLATSLRSGTLAMDPSSFIISTKTPAGFIPASLARSIAASVWPVRRRTPPGFAFKGKICPGLPSSSGFVSGSTNARMVFDLSLAEIPVVHP